MSRSRLAAEHKRRTGCTFADAARLHGLKSAGPVIREYRRIYEGVRRVRNERSTWRARTMFVPPSPERVRIALTFMREYAKTAEEAATVFSLTAEEIDVLGAELGERRAA
jgi:hypothetical protein